MKRRLTALEEDDLIRRRKALSKFNIMAGTKYFEKDDLLSEEDPDELNKLLEEEHGVGLFLIIDGSAVVRNTDDGFVNKKLKQGDFFGESDLLHTVGYTFFGDIIAESEVVEVLFIPSEKFSKIPLYEQVEMRRICQARKDLQMLIYSYCRKYPVTESDYASYYGA